ncbi:heterokaryon incompatibility protein-domain-containing protein [Xylariomycetidae sp. FL2044]|nr:heterokaryon incompatibility protein-domain-containing protein [Xylariomycetidae sp. FL2044]
MSLDLDKRLNGENGFVYPKIDAGSEVRLIRASYGVSPGETNYTLEAVAISGLASTSFRALSYRWGCANGTGDLEQIEVDGQPFFVRRNLYDFLQTAVAKRENGLFFIDAISINQNDHKERQRQVQQMAQIYRRADEVIAWLEKLSGDQYENVRSLSRSKGKDCPHWTARQWEAFRYLSYHPYWSRLWVVQEVLLAAKLIIWCGFFTFPRSLFAGSNIFDRSDRSASIARSTERLRSPAETLITHRTRHLLIQPLTERALGSEPGMLEEIRLELTTKPHRLVSTYQSHIPDPVHEVIRKFGKLHCSDPRDKLYGFLGILNERARASIVPDYTKGVTYAFYQALKLGLQEIYAEDEDLVVVSRRRPQGRRRREFDHGYFGDARDAFALDQEVAARVLRRVLDELHFRDRISGAIMDVRWRRQFDFGDDVEVHPELRQLMEYCGWYGYDDDIGEGEGEGCLFDFHQCQRRVAVQM